MNKRLLADLPLGFILRISMGLLILAFFSYLGIARHTRGAQLAAVQECGEIKELHSSALPALAKVKALTGCLKARNASLSGIGGPVNRPIYEILEALPATPCKYIGVWYAFRKDGVQRVTFKDNSDFLTESIKGGEATAETGFWGVHKQQMALFYEASWPPEIGSIEIDEDGSFMLTERNTTHTVFVRDKAILSTSCKG